MKQLYTAKMKKLWMCLIAVFFSYTLSASFYTSQLTKLTFRLNQQVNQAATVMMNEDNRNCGTITIGTAASDCTGATGTVGGVVFEDTNLDGTQTLPQEQGVAGVEVQLLNADLEPVHTVYTDTEGRYLFDNLLDDNYQIIFSLPEAISCWAKPGIAGSNGENTRTRPVTVGSCANWAIYDETRYCGGEKSLATTCFVDGEPLGGGSSGFGDVLVTYPYNMPDPDAYSKMKKVALNKDMGTAWGLGYDKNTQSFYAAAMLKRHAGFGPMGIDGIYRVDNTDPNNPVLEEWLQLGDLGVDVGENPRNYDLPADAAIGHTDSDAFALVGKAGMGDLDLSKDGKTLYVMNLNNNGSLVIIDIENKSLITEIPVSNPGCGADSDVRPWGIEIYNGEVYIGSVCTGETAGADDLKFFVSKLNGSSFEVIFEGSLNYPKGKVYPAHNEAVPEDSEACGNWEVWSDSFEGIHEINYNSSSIRWCRPQAILSDLEFDTDGSLILAFMDRTGHQTGYQQYNTVGDTLGSGYVGGDILRVYNNNGVFEMENGGLTSDGNGCGANGQGPGGGEFYCGEELSFTFEGVTSILHAETSLGALALCEEDDYVALNVMDPISIFSGGTAWMNNQTGQKDIAFELYNSFDWVDNHGEVEPGTFGKAAGLGDLELMCGPAPMEIGNLVWFDSNGNGLQDLDEVGLDGITLELIKDGAVIATTITADGGKYLFSQDGAPNQTWLHPGNRVLPEMDYIIRTKIEQLGINNPIATQLTENDNPLLDNDATLQGDCLKVALTTDKPGHNAHHFDIGIKEGLSLGNLVWEDLNNNGIKENNEKGIEGTIVTLFTLGPDGIAETNDDELVQIDTTDSSGHYEFTHLCDGQYYATVLPPAGLDMLSSTGSGANGLQPSDFENPVSPDNDEDNVDDGIQEDNYIVSLPITLTHQMEPSDDEDTDANTNTTLDFGLFLALKLGNRVWYDYNNNGLMDGGENGVYNVEVQLFRDNDNSLDISEADPLIAVTHTNRDGFYEFCRLFPGYYIVKLSGNIPKYYVSSDGNGVANYDGTGTYEVDVNPNSNESDIDDNGFQMGSMIITEPVYLELGTEPITDTDINPYTNTTIDFGIFQPNLITLQSPCSCLTANSENDSASQLEDAIVILSHRNDEEWTLKSADGISTPVSTKAKYIGIQNGYHAYQLKVIHSKTDGYEACFTNGTDNLTVQNQCDNTIVCTDDLTATPADPCLKNLIMPTDGTPRIDTLMCCDNKTTFSDDGLSHGLYLDTASRIDVYTICPPDQWKVLQFNFHEFELGAGDILEVYDGSTTTGTLLGTFEGTGVSQTGGWVAASCDPRINAGGCLTFKFMTNGLNDKGTGWHGTFECVDRNITLTPPDLAGEVACDEATEQIKIMPATVEADCGIVLDTQIIRIYDANGNLCKDTMIGGNEMFAETFGIGSYYIEYKLKSDTVKQTSTTLTINEPALVCNDNINIPLGSNCGILVTPDILLENPCDTITDTVYYHISLIGTDKNGSEKVLASGGGKGGNYPMLMSDMIDKCGGNIKAVIEKRYYEGLTLDFCNNGVQSIVCTTTINVMDQSAPLFTEPATSDTFKICAVSLHPDSLGLPTPKAVDNCGDVTVTFAGSQTLTDGLPCDTTRSIFTWVATDECGNTSRQEQMIVLIRPELTDIVSPEEVVLSCGEDNENDLNNYDKAGIPGLKTGRIVNGQLVPTDTIALSTEEYICGYILQHRDVALDSDCGKKLYRYWSMLDWCDSNDGPQALEVQLVEYRDTLPPTFVADALPAKVQPLSHNECTFNLYQLDAPEATDNCSELTVAISRVFRIEDGERWLLSAAEAAQADCDSFEVEWVAADACHEQKINDTIYQMILVKDLHKPGAVCTDQLTVSIANGQVKIHYSDIDAGSFDACGIERYEVSRDGENWSEYVYFDCSDIHRTNQVHLRITDKKGNQNTCWAEVLVEDKIHPICNELEDKNIFCDEIHLQEIDIPIDANNNGLLDDEWHPLSPDQVLYFNQEYGNPDCSDNAQNCDGLQIEQQYQLVSKSCGVAHLKRRYRAIDWYGEGNISNWAEQHIYFNYRPSWTITLPADWTGECGEEVPDNEVIINNGACDLLGVEVEEKTYTIVEDACFKVVRTFTIINWCTYQPDQAPYIIERIEDETRMADSRIITAEDLGEVASTTGKMQYTQVLKVNDNSIPEIKVASVDHCINENDCKENKLFYISATDCNLASTLGLDYQWTLYASGDSILSGTGNSFEYTVSPEVDYQVKWMVNDNCGNNAWEIVDYRFTDCKKPSPYCLHGSSVSLMPDVNMIQVWATDLDLGSFDNCTAPENLELRLWHNSVGNVPASIEEVLALPTVLTFDCRHQGYQNVDLYVIDEKGNYDFCSTYVDVQNNNNGCESGEPMASVSGEIRSWQSGELIENVELIINGEVISTTNHEGRYEYTLPKHTDYQVVPQRVDFPLNGVSTFDLVLISRHILGQGSFESPYQYIAADVNRSGSVTTYDMVQIRRLILNIDKEFSNNNSWRFIESDFELDKATVLSQNLPEWSQLNNLSESQKINFTGIKVGDINGNAMENYLVQSAPRTSSDPLKLTVNNQKVIAGKTYEVAFYANQLAEILGYQFTLNYPGLQFEKLIPGIANANNFGLQNRDNGYITTSWHHTTADKTNNKHLFTIQFTAERDGTLQELLSLNSRPTHTEAYAANGDLIPIELEFLEKSMLQFQVEQNEPNPFRQTTKINYTLPQASPVTLTIRDELGRIVHQQQEKGNTGHQSIQLDFSEKTTGILFYELESNFGIKVGKMIKID